MINLQFLFSMRFANTGKNSIVTFTKAQKMRRRYRIIRQSAAHIARAALRTLPSLKDTSLEHETHFTDRMLGRIEESMEGYIVNGVTWRAKTLTDRASGSQEKTYGADFAGVLEIALSDYQVKKGFLAQGKLLLPNKRLDRREYARTQEQCKLMLELSPASFVFVYTLDDIFVIPAISIVSSQFCDLSELYKRGIARFFEEHFESFIGDRRVNQATRQGLTDLNARRLLTLTAQG